MSYTDKRELLKRVYNSKSWAAKVNKMTEAQVIAVYFRLKQTNKI